jgi:hypothetical protein
MLCSAQHTHTTFSQAGVGLVLGFCTSYALKQLGKSLVLLIGFSVRAFRINILLAQEHQSRTHAALAGIRPVRCVVYVC